MARVKKQPFNPNMFVMDDGREIDAANQGAHGMALAGMQNVRERRALQDREDFDYNFGVDGQRGFGPGRFRNNLPDMNMDAYFGILQMKENAARNQGMKFGVDWPQGSQGAVGGRPTTSVLPGQESLDGVITATNDVNADLRHQMWQEQQRKGKR